MIKKMWCIIVIIILSQYQLVLAIDKKDIVIASAYCLQGKTSSGKFVKRGYVAADTRIYPLGTRLLLNEVREVIVADTGSAIKGMRIDIWMSCREAIKFGRKKMTVKVIK